MAFKSIRSIDLSQPKSMTMLLLDTMVVSSTVFRNVAVENDQASTVTSSDKYMVRPGAYIVDFLLDLCTFRNLTPVNNR